MVNPLSIPADAARVTAGAALATVDAVADAVANVFHGKEDHEVELLTAATPASNMYDLADPMLDISTIVYPLVELRKVATLKLKKLQDDRGLTDQSMTEMKQAHMEEQRLLEQIKSGGVGKAEDYKKITDEIEFLKKSKNLTDGDWPIFCHHFDILSLPKTAPQIKSDMDINADYIKEFLFFFGGKDFNMDAVQELVDRCSEYTLVHIDDDFTSKDFLGFKSEVVYGIFVSERLGKITIFFRGSVAANDWITNIQVNSTDLKLPGPDSSDAKIHGKVHKGFYNYLFGTILQEDGKMVSKADEIMEHLHRLLKKHPDFRIHVTGHSLGGALSTMMAFRAALDSGIKNTVLNVSFASPFVGDQEFRNAFQRLEGRDKIRHIRVSNDDDIVPLIPYMTLFSPPGMTYKHVGMNVKLYNKSFLKPDFKIFYPKVGSWLNEINNAIHSNLFLGLTLMSVPFHLCPEYRARLDAAKPGLRRKYLERLYSNKDIVGPLNELVLSQSPVPALSNDSDGASDELIDMK